MFHETSEDVGAVVIFPIQQPALDEFLVINDIVNDSCSNSTEMMLLMPSR